jgi:N-methylhydantoinase A
MRTAILPRAALATRKKYRGPAIITEYSATTVVPPGLPFQADKAGNLLVEVV